MNSKKAYAKVATQISQGKTKLEIFDDLKKTFGHDDSLAKIVGSFPDTSLAIKYRKVNILLFYILLFSALLKVAMSIPLILSLSVFALPLLLIIPILNLYFAFEVYKKRGYIYRILGILAIAGIFKSIDNIHLINIITIFNVLLMATISTLSFYLGKKMFPNYKFIGPKKNAEGVYQL